MPGPLHGVTVVELAGLGPAPFGCMVLADLGADVVRVQRPGTIEDRYDVLARGRRIVTADLKDPAGIEAVRDLAASADVFVEGFRPGVAERLGVGPQELCARNPRLVYARMTGWGQDGPMAERVGHDINYLGLTGALNAIGEPGRKPVPPLNLVADFGGGGMLLVTGVLAALVERATSGRGQVVDVAMVDGVSLLLAMAQGHRAAGLHDDERGTNLLDGGAPFYDTYATQDGRWMAVGALEPQFFAAMVATLDAEFPGVAERMPAQHDQAAWPAMRALLTEVFARRSREAWAAVFDGVDACVTPVRTLTEAGTDPHLAARGCVVRRDGLDMPAPAPRFSRTPASLD